MPLHFVAMLYPKPDRVDRVEEIARSVCDHVQENEPGVTQYQWFRIVGAEQPTIIVWETYADQAAVDAHKASSKMAWLQQTEKEESNMTEPVKVLPLDQFAGWVSRV